MNLSLSLMVFRWLVLGSLWCSLSTTVGYSQSVTLFDIDASAYPTMRAKFYAFDAQGKQQRPVAAELALTENTQARTVTSVTCPPLQQGRLSVVLLVDVTICNNLANAKSVLNSWLDQLGLGTNEVALVTYDGSSYLNQDFTTDRARLQQAVDNLQTRSSGEDHNGAMTRPVTGGISVAEGGKYKRVVLLLSSCSHFRQVDVPGIIARAQQSGVTLNYVIFDRYDWTPELTTKMALETGGFSVNKIPYNDLDAAKRALASIYTVAQGSSHCTIEWKSAASCQAGSTGVRLTWQGQAGTGSYAPAATSVASLEFSPAFCRFDSPTIGMPSTQSVTVTAMNAAFTVTNITSTNPAYTLTPTSFTLQAGQSRTLTLTYTADDSTYTFARFTLEHTLCPQTFFASGGYRGRKPKTPTLKLTRPNGGETFVVGSDTVITWEGIPATDLVQLDHTTDNGASWRRIDTARGLSYRWKNVPPPASSRCLVKVRHLDDSGTGGSSSWQELRTLRGHINSIIGVAFSPDGSMLASAGEDTIKIWDPATGQEIRTLRGHAGSVSVVAFSPDGTMLASASEDATGTVKLWNPQTGDTIRSLRGPASVISISFSPDGSMLATGSRDGTVKLWDPLTGQEIRTLRGHTDWVASVAFSRDGTMLASGSHDATVKLWEPQTGDTIRTLRGHAQEVFVVALSPDGTMLASGSADLTVKLWSVGDMSIQEDRSDAVFSIVEPLAQATDVDMGQCLVAATKDSVVVDLVRNVGTYPLNVRSITFTGADASAFALVSGQPVYSVSAGASRFGELRFRPARTGLHQALMVIVTQSDTLVHNIRGVGVAPALNVVSSLVDFGRIAVGSSKDTVAVATIRNVGTSSLTITDVRHRGPNDVDFTTIAGGGTFVLQPGKTQTMNLRFTASNVGRTSGTLEFLYSGFGSPAVVQLFGEGVYRGPQITGSATPLTLRCSADTTSTIALVNTGGDTLRLLTATITGAQAGEYALVTALPISVPAGDSAALTYSVRPAATGMRRATLELRTNVSGPDSLFRLPLAVQAERVEIGFAPKVIDLGTREPGDVVDTTASIANRGTLAGGYRLGADAGVIAPGGSLLTDGQSVAVPLRVRVPTAQGPFAMRVIATDSICGRADTLLITGNSRRADTVRTSIALPEITAAAGQAIAVNLVITAKANLDLPGAPRSFSATIALNPTVVHVTDPLLACTQVDAATCRYTITDTRGSSDTLARIPAVATLGTTDYAPLELVDFRWLDTALANVVTTNNGSIRITGVCEQGGVRLFVPTDARFSLASRPNPVSSAMELHFGLAEAAPVTIDIIDQTGRVVMTPVNETMLQAGAYTRSVDVSPLPVGPYVLMLRSPNSILHARMDVVR